MGLRFPMKYDNKMPIVQFRSFKYKMPAINLKPESLNRVSTGNNVSLYLPGNYAEHISATWSPQDVIGGATSGLMAGAETEAYTFLKQAAGQKVGATIEGGTGTVSYPTDILIFDSVTPISLSFNFNMVPINSGEAEEIIKICTLFKQKILPFAPKENTVGRLDFPDTWDISFHQVNGLGLEEVGKYTEMALMAVNVSFPSGGTSVLTFRDENPVQTQLDLTFQSIRKHRMMG